MCLSIIDWKAKSEKDYKREVKTGWKVFSKWHGNLLKPCFSAGLGRGPGRNGYKVGKWLEDVKDGFVNDFFGKFHYKRGFHIFKTRKSARKCLHYTCLSVIKKVEYTNVVAEGTQIREQVIVAKKMKILKEKV